MKLRRARCARLTDGKMAVLHLMRQKSTMTHYMYWGAGNWKFYGSFIFKGNIAYSELEPYMFDHEFFVAAEVGLKHLLPETWTEDNHYLHQFEEFDETEETDYLCDAEELKTRFMNAHKLGWIRRLSECPVF
jgi:hypothetical protein